MTANKEYSLSQALITGQSKLIPKTMYIKLKRLNLLHLFTLSGIHLTTLLTFLGFFIKRRWLILVFGCSFFWIDSYFALKRMLLLRILSIKLSNLQSFWIVFGLDFLFGTYRLSPFSFIFSFSCLGILITSQSQSKLAVAIEIMLMQFFLGYWISQSIYPLSFLANYIVIPIFNLTFPLFYLFKPIPALSNHLEQAFSNLVNFLYPFLTAIPPLKLDSLAVIFLVLIMIRVHSKQTILILGFFFCSQLNNNGLSYEQILKMNRLETGEIIKKGVL